MCKTAKVLRQATNLLKRDLYPKDRARIRKQGRPVRAAKMTLGGRPAVALTFADGSTLYLSARRTGGTVFRNGRPLVPQITLVREAAPPVIANGNGSNGRTAPRQRGAGRPRAQAGSRSSSSSGDDSDEPEPPSRRLCAFCNHEIPARRATQARYCSDRHAERDRKQRTRRRNRQRAAKPLEHLGAYRVASRDEYDELLRLARCRCNGRHLIFADWPGHCIRCGHGAVVA
jgi:hypothetical protein